MYLEIDGSEGEGGGQILRSSLAMSAVLNKPVRIRNIRAGRSKPGLQAQHLTCVNALAEITDAEMKGADLGSQELTFVPHALKPGKYRFDVAQVRSSAGSISLVFQAVVIPLALAGGDSELTLLGGTHVEWSPPVHYLQIVYLPTIARMGLEANIQLKMWGWYPKGGGEAVAEIHPARLRGIDLSDRGALKSIKGISALSNLPRNIALRQQDQSLKILKSGALGASFDVVNAPSRGQGTAVFILAEFEKSRAGFTSLGARGKRAEKVGEEASKECVDFLKTSAAIEEHLADQLVPFMALAEGHSCFTASRISLHLLTNIWVAEQFLPVKFQVDGEEGQPGRVSVDGAGFRRPVGEG
jgi:RNA 3'-terminal phosphate cyclase (ATP)